MCPELEEVNLKHIATCYLSLMLLPDFTFFDVSCKFFHKLLSFHPVDNRLFIFSTVAKKCLAIQTQGHSCNKNSKRQIFPT